MSSGSDGKVDLGYTRKSYVNLVTKTPFERADPVSTGVADIDALSQMIAEDGGYLRGKQTYIKSCIYAVLAGIDKAIRDGKTVVLDGYFKFNGTFVNLDPETGKPTRETIYKVRALTLDKMQFKASTAFNLSYVGSTTPSPAITDIRVCGALDSKKDTIVQGKDIRLSGRNLYFNAAQGDTLTLSFTDEGEEQSITVTPTEIETTCMKIPFPAALAEVEAGTVVNFTLATRRGVENGPFKSGSRKATLATE